MTKRHIEQIRLRDLEVFQAIMDNRSITVAADVLGASQSAVSKQLKQLRQHFDDELFVRTGDGMVATTLARSIEPRMRRLIEDFEALREEGSFSPQKIERTFTIATSDEIQYFLLPELVKVFEETSPRSRIIFRALDRDFSVKQIETGTVDLVVTMNWRTPEHFKQKRLFTDNFVCLLRADHPLAEDEISMDQYLSARHMMVSPMGTGWGPVDEMLSSLGHRRFVSLACPYFMQVGDALKDSELILTIQRRVAKKLIREYPLAINELPITLHPANYSLFWHRRYDKDSSNAWIRKVIWEILHD
ncbi:MAG: LysR family transcriptional regulator [Haliea sp.]|uniref:LysR family transcriptional regulator n=1 Tax=Marinobacter salarius TaxID=1420917 RepID=UPI0032EAC287